MVVGGERVNGGFGNPPYVRLARDKPSVGMSITGCPLSFVAAMNPMLFITPKMLFLNLKNRDRYDGEWTLLYERGGWKRGNQYSPQFQAPAFWLRVKTQYLAGFFD